MSWASVASGAAVFAGLTLLAYGLRALLHRYLLRRQIRSDMALLVDRTVFYGLITLAVVIGLGFAFDQASIAANGVLIAALLTGLGLSDLVKNYVSGFYVLFERHLKPGDVIENGGYTGVVTDVKFRVTLLRTEAGELVVIPNSDLFTKPIRIATPPPAAPVARRTPPAPPAPASRSARPPGRTPPSGAA